MENYLWAFWILAGIVLLIFEIFTPGFVVSLIGVACIITGVFSIFVHNFLIQLIVFSLSILLVMIFARPVLMKYFVNTSTKKSNVDALIGKECMVDTEIDNARNTGYIKMGADYWKAKSNDGSIIPKGSVVVIEKMEGITATVSVKN